MNYEPITILELSEWSKTVKIISLFLNKRINKQIVCVSVKMVLTRWFLALKNDTAVCITLGIPLVLGPSHLCTFYPQNCNHSDLCPTLRLPKPQIFTSIIRRLFPHCSGPPLKLATNSYCLPPTNHSPGFGAFGLISDLTLGYLLGAAATKQ